MSALKSNRLIELKEEIHPDVHAQLAEYAKSNEFELGYAVEHIFRTFFADPKNKKSRKSSAEKSGAAPQVVKAKAAA